MKKLSRSAREDMKGFVRVAETWLEIALMSLAYYVAWERGYDFYGGNTC